MPEEIPNGTGIWYKEHYIIYTNSRYWAIAQPFKTLKAAQKFIDNYINRTD